jgi:hypothetical protein
MGGFRAKFIFLLVVYFAGFCTAIYFLAPVPKEDGFGEGDKKLFNSAFASNEFAVNFSSTLHKCVDYGKRAALEAADFLKAKYHKRQLAREG